MISEQTADGRRDGGRKWISVRKEGKKKVEGWILGLNGGMDIHGIKCKSIKGQMHEVWANVCF